MAARPEDATAPEPSAPSSPPFEDPSEVLDTDFLREAARAPAIVTDEVELTGATLGRYRVGARLGRGGMGVVYAAEDPLLRRPVALKILFDRHLTDPGRRRRLLREARSAAAAAHPNIAAIHDVLELDGRVVIVMERVEGRTLRAVIASAWAAGGMRAQDIARLGAAAAEGLEGAHRAGVIHRDLKPDNVMVTPEGRVKILDFGVAKLREAEAGDALRSAMGSHTEEGRVIGTPSYIAPEQAQGLAVDARADLFSLGVILYEMATGTRPFQGATPIQVLMAIGRDAPTPPSSRRPQVPASLEAIILRCLEKRPEDRFAHAAEVAEALRRLTIADGEAGESPPPALATPVAAPGAANAPPRRRRVWSLLGLAALAALPLALRGAGAPGATASPLATSGAVIACPPLEVAEAAPAAGWLGAAAASAACRRARALLGGAAGRALPPAALLDLPRQPREDLPIDPYASADARPRALAAGRERAAAFLDGRVHLSRGRFEVRLALRAPAGHTLAEGEGRGASLLDAVRAAMEPLIAAGALPRAEAADPEAARWSGIGAADLMLAVEDASIAAAGYAGAEQEAERLAPRRQELGARWAQIMADRAAVSGEGWRRVEAPALDRGSAPAFARSAPLHALLAGGDSAGALADEARALAAAEPSRAGRAALAFAEARLRAQAGDATRASALALSAVEEDPAVSALELLFSLSRGRPAQVPVARAYAAWAPDAADAWNALSYSVVDSELALELMRRAHALSAGEPMLAVHLGMELLVSGRREEARAVAAELLASGDGRGLIAGDLLLAELDASEGRIGAALDRARRALLGLPAFGRFDTGELYLLTLVLELSQILGIARESAEAFVRAYMDPEPPRIYPGQHVPARIAAACAQAPEAVARRCSARLGALLRADHFREPLPMGDADFIRGAEAFGGGDHAAAAAAWRSLLRRPASVGRHLLPIAFDRAGEPELAERLDERLMQMKWSHDNGAGLARLRAARRARARGDHGRAAALAREIIDAWSAADVPVPGVAEARALLSQGAQGSTR